MKVAHIETFDDNGIGKVLNFYGDEKFAPDTMTLYEVTTEEQVVEKFGKMAEMYFDKNSGTLFYQYTDRPLTSEEQLFQLQEASKTSDQKYKELDLTTAALADVQNAKITQIKYLCEQTIYAGFVSASTGHTFGLDLKDQANFEQQRSDFIDDTTVTTVDWGTKDAGTVTLTKEQFFTVRGEGKQFKWNNINKARTLCGQVMAATTNADVDAVAW